jgi:hypothetical protein
MLGAAKIRLSYFQAYESRRTVKLPDSGEFDISSADCGSESLSLAVPFCPVLSRPILSCPTVQQNGVR